MEVKKSMGIRRITAEEFDVALVRYVSRYSKIFLFPSNLSREGSSTVVHVKKSDSAIDGAL